MRTAGAPVVIRHASGVLIGIRFHSRPLKAEHKVADGEHVLRYAPPAAAATAGDAPTVVFSRE